MRVLITGGAGFQGSHLTERLVRDGHAVTVLSTLSDLSQRNIAPFANDVSLVWGSVTDAEIVDKTVRDQDAVVHMAARVNVDESIDSPIVFLAVNVIGTYNVLEAARKAGTRVVLASTCEVYGSSNPSPLTECADLRPHSPYAASKAGADRLCYAYHKTYGMNVTVVRPCNIYGERQKSGRGGAVIPIFVERALAGEPLELYGSGTREQTFTYVKDVARACALALAGGQSGLYNIAGPRPVTMEELAKAVLAAVPHTSSTILYSGKPDPNEGVHRRISLAKAQAGLGYMPAYDIAAGLGEMVRELLNPPPPLYRVEATVREKL